MTQNKLPQKQIWSHLKGKNVLNKAPVTYHSGARMASKTQPFCTCSYELLCTKIGKTAVFYSPYRPRSDLPVWQGLSILGSLFENIPYAKHTQRKVNVWNLTFNPIRPWGGGGGGGDPPPSRITFFFAQLLTLF